MFEREMFFVVNEQSESQNAVSILKEFLTKVETDQYYLKWAILAGHNALQGFMVLALKGTSSLPILKANNSKKPKSAYDLLTDPNIKLDNFLNLFEKTMQSDFMQKAISAETIEEISDSIACLNEIRNYFVHFLPRSWSIETLLVYQLLADVLAIITLITQQCNELQMSFSESELLVIQQTLAECTALVNQHL